MPRYGMVVDVTKCDGCYNCFIVCKDEYCRQAHPGYSAPQPMTGQFWMKIVGKERGQFPKVKQDYIPVPCMHCEAPACATGSDGAVYKRADGIVIIDPEKAAGSKDIVSRCPYRVIYWNEEENVAQKCTFCAHLLDAGWKEPRCVEACPTGALIFGDLDDPDSAVSKAMKSAEAMHPEYKLGEKVRFIGLPRNFVAGSVILGDTDECAKGATVTLAGEEGTKTTETDAFGDFEFEGLPDNKVYRVTVSAPGYRAEEREVRTYKSLYLGEIFLQK
ncbi:MAG: carboxypeptidase regulatory-like domain-containing protein [Actinomycetia bacterium]|nr:carboxypeptidase regulatory-like domain-containing protein [Actinomycetes bacterium]